MAHDFETYFEQRLAALERQNRRLKYAVLGLLLLAFVFVLATVAFFLIPVPLLRATKFVAVDQRGVVRAEMDASNLNMSSVSVYDRHGKLMASLCENGGRACLFFFDAQKDMDLLALYPHDDGAMLVIKDSAGRKRVELVATAKERRFQFFDEAGRPIPANP